MLPFLFLFFILLFLFFDLTISFFSQLPAKLLQFYEIKEFFS